jgi:hypothetical protein
MVSRIRVVLPPPDGDDTINRIPRSTAVTRSSLFLLAGAFYAIIGEPDELHSWI